MNQKKLHFKMSRKGRTDRALLHGMKLQGLIDNSTYSQHVRLLKIPVVQARRKQRMVKYQDQPTSEFEDSWQPVQDVDDTGLEKYERHDEEDQEDCHGSDSHSTYSEYYDQEEILVCPHGTHCTYCHPDSDSDQSEYEYDEHDADSVSDC